MRIALPVAAAAGMLLATQTHAQVTSVGPPSAAVSDAVAVSGPSDTIYVSGITPPSLDPGAPKGAPPRFGDTKTQTIGILKRIDAILRAQGYALGDIAMMRVYLVADPAKGGKMDFPGMMEGYTQFFGTASQPRKPSRATVQVAGLVDEGQLVEIEVQAVRPHKAR